MRRRVFRNPEPLMQKAVASLEQLPLESFPTITDFLIETRPTSLKFGNHLYFVSESNGDLISFPWWDHVERQLGKWTREEIPLGTQVEPYYDLEQGWQLIIFAAPGFVYLMQGGDPSDRRAVFDVWFRVPRKLYLAAWDRVLTKHNPNYLPEWLRARRA